MTADHRESIPREIRRAIEVEAGHKCAITNCNEHTYLEIHHINQKKNDNRLENLILLCDKHHKMAHDKVIDIKSLQQYKYKLNLSNNIEFIRSQECDRVANFLSEIKDLITENCDGDETIIGTDAYYFFQKEIYNKMEIFFNNSDKYEMTLKSFDPKAYKKQDYIYYSLREIFDCIDSNYIELGNSFKLVTKTPWVYGDDRDKVIEYKNLYINERLHNIFACYHELKDYVTNRASSQ